MSDLELLKEAAERAGRGERFALATVVRREAPSSARPGRKALVRADGSIRGWLGGACIEPTVRREALAALEDGEPRLLVFAPGGAEAHPEAAERDGTAVYPMTCHSGGTVEVYLEPQLPSPALAVFGDSPVSRALAAMAPEAGFAVRAVGMGEAASAYPEAHATQRLEVGPEERPAGRGDEGPGAEEASPTDEARASRSGGTRELHAVVATMGEWDEDAVRQALEAGAAYVGLVASPRRADEVRRRLAEDGVPGEALERLVSPAGLDLGAREPGEIAVTILAEVIQRRRARPAGVDEGTAGRPETGTGTAGPSTARGSEAEAAGPGEAAGETAAHPAATRAPGDDSAGFATDPVCGMTVEVAGARHVHEHRGTLHYFCCPGCLRRFAEDPDRWTAV